MQKSDNQFRSGFTLLELLVVVVIILVLMAFLVPSFAKARRMARRQLCSTQLRGLTQASIMYRVNNGRLPFPLMNYGTNPATVYPADVQLRLLNDLGPYCGMPIPLTNASKNSDIPRFMQCPFVVDWAQTLDGPWSNCLGLNFSAGPATVQSNYIYTGYAYYYGTNAPSINGLSASAGKINPKSVDAFIPYIDAAAPSTGVLWADGVGVWSNNYCYYGHVKSPVFGKSDWSFAHTNFKSFEGMHIGRIDGSVDWNDASRFDINTANLAGSSDYRSTVIVEWFYWFRPVR